MAEQGRSGLWGAVRFDGGSVDPDEAASLGLAPNGSAMVVGGRDQQDPDLATERADKQGLTILTGWIADHAELARGLGLPQTCLPAALARAALLRFGADLPAHMLGEWSLFHATREGAVWLIQSATTRDPLFYAVRGADRIAFAPDARALSRIDWIGAALDPEAICMSLGREGVRMQLATRSIYRGIARLMPGSSLVLSPDGTARHSAIDLLSDQPRFTGSSEDALAALEDTMRAVMRDRLGRCGRPVVLLSGGLDSSLLAALAAQELAAPPYAICSAAPPGWGIADEFGFAQAVADHCGIDLAPVFPEPDADPYRAAPHILAGADGALISNRHCLSSAFEARSRQLGGTVLVNGCYGELTVTARLPGSQSIRQRLGALRRWLQPVKIPASGDFHAVLAQHRRSELSEISRAIPPAAASTHRPSDQIGYLPGTIKALAHPNAFFAGSLRTDFPFRDLRLLRLYASLPRALALSFGADRGPVRTIGIGLLPEQTRVRKRGMPADPGHYSRLQRFAAPARGRIAHFRAVGIDDWLDLDWLDGALARVAQHGVLSVVDANEVQLTALAAEYLVWLHGAHDPLSAAST